MALKIAILEDNLDRQTAMKAWLSDRLYMYEQAFFDDADLMIDWLKSNRSDLLFVSLDHDLDLKPSGDGRWLDPGTGREVADYLAQQTPLCPILIHSTNADAVEGMQAVLQEHGWTITTIRPYGDLAWINEAWWPAVKEQLRAWDPVERLSSAEPR